MMIFLKGVSFLHGEAPLELDYTVRAEKPSSEIEQKSQDIQVIEATEIEKLGEVSLIDVLEKKGNIHVMQYGASGSTATVYMRNFSGSAVAILVDGVQVNSAQSGEFDLGRINLASVERIEIVNGASDSTYAVSGAVGGIINIITKKDDSSEKPFSFFVDVSNLSYVDAVVRGKPGKASFFDTQKVNGYFYGNNKSHAEKDFDSNWHLGVSFLNAKNRFSYIHDNTLKQNEDSENRNFGADLGFSVSFEKASFDFSDSFHIGRCLCAGSVSTVNIGLQKDLFNSSVFTMRFPFAFNGYADIQGRLAYKLDKIDYDENIVAENDESFHNLHSFVFNVSSKIFCSEDLIGTVCLDLTENLLKSSDCINDCVNRLDGGLSFLVSYKIGKSFYLYPFAKMVFASDDFAFVPKLGGKIVLNTFDFSFNAYRMFVFPTLNQLYWKDSSYAVGNPNLENEKGVGFDLGFSVKPSEILKCGEIVFFANYYEDKISWANGPNGKLIPENAGNAAYFGSKIKADFAFSKNLSFGFQYDFALTYLLTDGLTLKDNVRIMYTPVHKVNVFAELDFDKLFFGLYGNFTGKRYISNLNLRSLDPYFLLDFVSSVRFNENYLVHFDVNNLLNMEYSERDEYPLPGISFNLGFKYSY